MNTSHVSGKVLVVDDDPAAVAVIRAALEPIGLVCLPLRSAEEALSHALDEGLKLAVVDGLLPGMRGDELVQRLRQARGGNLPVIFVSAFFRDMRSYTYLTKDVGVDAFLRKPLDPHLLREAAERLVSPAVLPDIQLDLSEMEAPSADSAPAFEIPADLVAEYLETARGRTTAIRASLAALPNGNSAELLKRIRGEAHKLRGTGSSFGYPEISRLGAEIEELLTNDEGEAILEVDTAQRARLAGLGEAIELQVVRASGMTPIEVAPPGTLPSPRVVLVDGPMTGLALSCADAPTGGRLQVYDDADRAVERVGADHPDVVFVAADRDEVDAAALCARLRATGTPRLVLMSRRDTLEDRLQAVRLGASGFVPRPLDAAGLMRLAREFGPRRSGARILALDPDIAFLRMVAEQLAPLNVAVEPCTTPETLFRQLADAPPSLVLMEATLPTHFSLDLLRAVRADIRARRLPVIIVSDSGRKRDRMAAFEAGADDFLQKPVDPHELSARVLVHLERFAQLERERVRDPLTGTWTRAAFLETADRALNLARRNGRPVAILAVACGTESVRRVRGTNGVAEILTAVAERLRIAFRSSDVIARIGEDSFGVLLHDAPPQNAKSLLDTELSGISAVQFEGPLGPFQLAARGGLACFPDVDGAAEVLLSHAEKALVLS